MDEATYWNLFWDGLVTKTPWESPDVDENLISCVQSKRFSNSLDIGCGSGINTIYISTLSEKVDAIDVSKTAIDLAKKRSRNNNINFQTVDFLNFNTTIFYDFIFDRGCIHGIRSVKDKNIFVNKISNLLSDQGIWLSLIGSAEDVEYENGPPRWGISDIVSVIDPYLKISLIKECKLKNRDNSLFSAWMVLSQKRSRLLNRKCHEDIQYRYYEDIKYWS